MEVTVRENKQKIYSEVNIQMAIPFTSKQSTASNSEDTTICVSDQDVSKVLKIKSSNEAKEALTPLAYDVLNCILDFARHQLKDCYEKSRPFDINNFQVFFTYRQICEKLKLNPSNSQGNISKAIKSLRKIDLKVVGHAFDLKDKSYNLVDKEFNLIKDIEKNLVNNSSTSSIRRSVTLDPLIVGLMSSDFSVNREKYLMLSQGKERRAFMFIQAKKKVLGNTFSFDADELASVLGDSAKRKDNKKRSLKKVLEALKLKLSGFEYVFKAVYGTGKIEILVDFEEEQELEFYYETEFYKDLVYYYTQESLVSVDFFEADYIEVQDRLSQEYYDSFSTYEVLYRNKKIRYADLVIDLALFQILRSGYKKMSLRKLVDIISSFYLTNEQFQLPDGYLSFVSSKVFDLKKKERAKKVREEMQKRQQREKVEEEAKNESFDTIFENFIKPNKELYAEYLLKAEEEIREEHKDLSEEMIRALMPMHLEVKVKALAQRDYLNPDNSIFVKYMEKSSKELTFNEVLQISNEG